MTKGKRWLFKRALRYSLKHTAWIRKHIRLIADEYENAGADAHLLDHMYTILDNTKDIDDDLNMLLKYI